MKMYPPIEMNDFELPVKIEKDSEYVDRVEKELDMYNDFVAKFAAENHSGYPRLKDVSKNVLDNVQTLKDALKNYFSGRIQEAHSLMRSYIEKYNDVMFNAVIDKNYAFRGISVPSLRPSFYAGNEYYVKEYERMMTWPLSFFKARVNGDFLERKDMLHIPFNKREIVSNWRFSVTGLPCLYLSSTTWGSWIEMGEPDQNKFQVSALKIPGNLKVLNLCIQQYLIGGMSSFITEQEAYDRILLLVEFMPLVIASSFRVTGQKERVFKSEYVIPQLIMQACLELGIDGVAYLSRRTDDMIAYPYAVNLALLMTGESKSKYWSRANEVELTEPVRFSEFMMLPENERDISDREEYKSFVNEFYAKDRDGGHGMINLAHKRIPYIDTYFAALDEYLLDRVFRKFEEPKE